MDNKAQFVFDSFLDIFPGKNVYNDKNQVNYIYIDQNLKQQNKIMDLSLYNSLINYSQRYLPLLFNGSNKSLKKEMNLNIKKDIENPKNLNRSRIYFKELKNLRRLRSVTRNFT